MNHHAEFIVGDCLHQLDLLKSRKVTFDLIFLDPPFNQGKTYAYFNDAQPCEDYWNWIGQVCSAVYAVASSGASIYFMHREKNAEHVLRVLRESGWTFQNLIIWTKRASAVPSAIRFAKQYQIIAFATKGNAPRVFHRLRVDLPLRPEYRNPRQSGVYLTDVWDDIRELTSGYFAGNEPLRDDLGRRLHTQQSPVALLTRILLSSSAVGDWILDPFAGTGTTAVVASQLKRNSVSIEIDPRNVALARRRLESRRIADDITPLRAYYRYTPDLDKIWTTGEHCACSGQQGLSQAEAGTHADMSLARR